MDEPIDETNVEIAVRFLNNSNVKETEKEKQEAFLKSKGLSCAEIDEAYKRVSELEIVERDDDSWSIFDYLKGVVLSAGILSAANFAYKAYILPYATRELKDDQRIEGLIESFQVIKDDIKQHTYELSGTLKQIQALMEENQKSLTIINSELRKDTADTGSVDELKNEISNLKSIMLSKDQFPATPYTSTNQKVNAIPAWQKIAEEFNSENITVESDEQVYLKDADQPVSKAVQPVVEAGDAAEEVIAIIPGESEIAEITPVTTETIVTESQESQCSDVEVIETPVQNVGAEAEPCSDDENDGDIRDEDEDDSEVADKDEKDSNVVDINENDSDKDESGSDVPVTTEVNGILYEVVPSVDKLLPVDSNPEIFSSELSKEIFIEGTDVLRSEYDLTISQTDKDCDGGDEETKNNSKLDSDIIEKGDIPCQIESGDAGVAEPHYEEVD